MEQQKDAATQTEKQTQCSSAGNSIQQQPTASKLSSGTISRCSELKELQQATVSSTVKTSTASSSGRRSSRSSGGRSLGQPSERQSRLTSGHRSEGSSRATEISRKRHRTSSQQSLKEKEKEQASDSSSPKAAQTAGREKRRKESSGHPRSSPSLQLAERRDGDRAQVTRSLSAQHGESGAPRDIPSPHAVTETTIAQQ